MAVTLAGSEEEENLSEDEEDRTDVHEARSDDDADMVYEGGLNSSDDEPEHGEAKQAKPGKAAYFGMQKRDSAAPAKEYEGLSLVEQEALALRMINR